MLSSEDRAKVDQYRLLMANVYELSAISRRVSEAIAQRASMTTTQWHVMSAVSEQDSTVPQIAGRLGVTRQAIQRVADQLCNSGHTTRVPNPRHGSSPLLQLTRHGRETLQTLWELSDQPRAEMLSDITAAAMAEANATLESVVGSLRATTPEMSSRPREADSPG